MSVPEVNVVGAGPAGLTAAITLLVVALACSMPVPVSAQAPAKLKVVATTSDLASLAEEVGGEHVDVESLIRGNQDPHFVQIKPTYLLKLRRADLLIVVGLDLEGAWLTEGHHRPSLMSQSGNPRIQPGASGYFDASQYAEIIEIPKPPITPNIYALGNPHFWLDPENARRIAQGMTEKLRELRPTDAAYFADRFQAFNRRLSNAEKIWDAEMQPYHGRKVVTYQRSWSYFLKRFQLVSVGEIEPQPGIPPSRTHTRELIQTVKSENARIILAEPYFELSTAKAIARATGAKIVVMLGSVGGERGINDYFQLFDHDLALLTKALRETQ
jgi:ABC-type Zn uptake system ZnuABC Zn-binding protein ZnuA